MSQLDLQALEANFQGWRDSRAPGIKESDAFELYAIEQVLKDADLTDEDLSFGQFGSADDGGVDGMYFFVNRILIKDVSDAPATALEAELVIIQAKLHAGFSETAVQKLEDFTNDLLDFTKNVNSLTYLNSQAREAIEIFRESYSAILKDAPSFKISFHYVTKSITPPGNKVEKRIENLKAAVTAKISNADFEFQSWGSVSLLAVKRKTAKQIEIIPVISHFGTPDGSVVCLVLLRDFAALLTNESDGIKTQLLEANVRDYQGNTRKVNEAIKETLDQTAPKEDFWWLNNGITILADDCPVSAQKLAIKRPEIVNGLQTSYEIYHARKTLAADKRTVLLRIITAKDETSRNNIIKATNSQTPINPLTLRATEKIHFDIEDKLALYQLYYDRKKGKYKQLGRPISQIVSMREMAQAVMTILLQRPDDARGRPQTVIDNDVHYEGMFNSGYKIDTYAASILIDRQVIRYLSLQSLAYDLRRDIRYYALLIVTCDLAQSRQPTPDDIAALLPKANAPIDEAVFAAAVKEALGLYNSAGGNNQAAKSPLLTAAVKSSIAARHS
mgnify:FL=1|jgi:hypothetical protein